LVDLVVQSAEIAELTSGSVDPDLIRDIFRFAKRNKRQADALLGSFDRRASPTTQWLEAALLEAAGKNKESAEVLNALTDLSWGEERALRLLAVARNQELAGNHQEACQAAGSAARVASSLRTMTAIEKFINELGNNSPIPAKRHCKIGVVGSATLDLRIPALRACCFSWGIDAEIYNGPFQQFMQEILDPSSGLAAFQPDIVIIAVDWRALTLPEESGDPDALVAEKLGLFRQLWEQCRDRLGANVIQHNFEIPEIDPLGRLSASLAGGRASVLQKLNMALEQAANEMSSVGILDLNQIASLYGKQRWNDEVLWQAAKQYPATDAIPGLVRQEAAIARASLGLTSKCVVLDLDNTLWGGVIGEDGLGGIKLGGSAAGESYVAFQKYLLALQRRGIILAVCSKNNEADAKSPFLQHPEMVLKLDDISLFVANWKAKDENLRDIAATLNIGLDSMVFVDDNPVERNLVRQLIPELEVPEMPSEPAHYAAALHRSQCFEAWSLTSDDRHRASAYRENVLRREQQAASGNVDDYLASLEMQVELRSFDQANLARVVQLINKTNQFNLTTRRITEPECASLMGRTDCYTQFMRLKDRFGDNGITGILIAFIEDDSLRIDNWLISCRVLGRRVEDAMLGTALEHAVSRGCRWVTGEFIPTAKNAQVREIYLKFGFDPVTEDPDGRRIFRFDNEKYQPLVPTWMKIV
jgi:FkbH-like protein